MSEIISSDLDESRLKSQYFGAKKADSRHLWASLIGGTYSCKDYWNMIHYFFCWEGGGVYLVMVLLGGSSSPLAPPFCRLWIPVWLCCQQSIGSITIINTPRIDLDLAGPIPPNQGCSLQCAVPPQDLRMAGHDQSWGSGFLMRSCSIGCRFNKEKPKFFRSI